MILVGVQKSSHAGVEHSRVNQAEAFQLGDGQCVPSYLPTQWHGPMLSVPMDSGLEYCSHFSEGLKEKGTLAQGRLL